MLLLFCSCSAEDRSDEQPLAPTVQTTAATVTGSSCLFSGEVLSSPNSSLRKVGFVYGNDTLNITLACEDTLEVFFLTVDSFAAGSYWVAAYATNYIGTSYGDTLAFLILE